MRALIVAAAIASLVPGAARASAPSPATAPSETPPSETPPSDPPPDDAPPAPDVDPRAQAADAFMEGSKAFELGQFSRAVEKFELAWELSHEPLLLFNLGQAEYRWFKVDGDPAHLRKARVYYENYDKRMRTTEGYEDDEIRAILRSLELELEKAEESKGDRVQRELAAKAEADRRAALIEREKRLVKGFNASGNTLIAVGAATLVMGFAGMMVRVANKVVLDNSSSGDRGVNIASAEEDARQREAFLVGGQIAFAGFIIGGILLPAGIALRVVGEVKERRALTREKSGKQRAKLDITGSGLTVKF
jgi:hypothetical protein